MSITTGCELVTKFQELQSSPFKMDSLENAAAKNCDAFNQSLATNDFSKPSLQTRFWWGNLASILLKFSIKFCNSSAFRLSRPLSCNVLIVVRFFVKNCVALPGKRHSKHWQRNPYHSWVYSCRILRICEPSALAGK